MNQLFYIFALVFSCYNSFAASPLNYSCNDGLVPPLLIEDKIARLDDEGREIFNLYQEIDIVYKIDQFVSKADAVEIALESDVEIYRKTFKEWLLTVRHKQGNRSLDTIFSEFITKILKSKFFSEKQIKDRFNEWKRNPNNSDRWFRLLGDRSLSEVYEMFVGAKAGEIDANSLIGKYIEISGAKSRKIRYPLSPKSAEKGDEKIVVAVGPNSFQYLKEVFGRALFMSVIGHANLVYGKHLFSYGGEKLEFRFPSEGTPFPFVLLKTSESERLERYLLAATTTHKAQSWNGTLKIPWLNKGYCAEGGYICCTHWIGNLPLGDLRVPEYSFPGSDAKPHERRQLLKQYESNDLIIKKIWKVPGNQQFANLLGLESSNVRGEFASPGWVIQSLMGAAPNNRVPVIFWFVNDHTVENPELPNFVFENPY